MCTKTPRDVSQAKRIIAGLEKICSGCGLNDLVFYVIVLL